MGVEMLWSWKAVAYAIVLGLACLLLVPLTDLWWIVPLLGAATPVALIAMAMARRSRGQENLEQRAELLAAVATHGRLTPLDAARLTSCTAVEAAHLMDVLASEGALTRIPEGRSGPIAPAASLPLPASMQRQEAATAVLPPTAPIARAPFALAEPLTDRELEVLTLLAAGRTNSEAARALFISVGTVKSHTGNIYRKLGAKNRTEAIARARQAGLIP
jgi:DNA-binding CsgD family transcriptional regulator